jgi:hypothetical protein
MNTEKEKKAEKKAMKKLILLTMCMVLIGAGAAMADQIFTNTTTVLDQNGTSYPYPTVIGDFGVFGTYRATLNTSTGMFTITTNWNPGKDEDLGLLDLKTAFLFVESGGNTYAIDLDKNTYTGNVYINYTSTTNSNDPSWSWTKGGYLYGASVDGSPIQVIASGGTSSTTDVTWSSLNPTNLNNTVAVDLNGILGTGPWAFLWATAECANGPFEGGSFTGVPLPPSALLLGSGLLGLAGMGWRRRKTNV